MADNSALPLQWTRQLPATTISFAASRLTTQRELGDGTPNDVCLEERPVAERITLRMRSTSHDGEIP